MGSTTITIPDFKFASFYYPQLLEELIQWKRIYVPELTDESAEEPLVQMLRAYALVGHLSTTLIDLVANESTLTTAQLVEQVRNMLRLIDYEMSSETPSQAQVVYELASILTDASTPIVPADSQVATKSSEGEVVYFEAPEDSDIGPTNVIDHAFGHVPPSTWTDGTTEINSETTPADDWTPWAAADTLQTAIYIGHTQVMWDKVKIEFTTPMAGTYGGIWEYYENDWRQGQPTSVTDLGATLEFDLTSILGTVENVGAAIRVQLNETTAYEDVLSTWDGVKNIATTTGLLGQSSPSIDPNDYTIGSNWVALTEIIDGTNGLSENGEVVFALPQTEDNNWTTSEVNGETAFWIRWRMNSVTGTPTNPVLQYAKIDVGKQYIIDDVIQGQLTSQDPLGSSSGVSDQRFQLSQKHFILGSETVTVEGEEWRRVDDFLGTQFMEKIYKVELGDDDTAEIVFAPEGAGRVPPLGINNIGVPRYRFGADLDGNVGSGTITVDKTGLTYVNKLFNPRQAIGWSASEGATPESLEQAKQDGPATLRIKEVALNGDDAVIMGVAYVDDNGVSPFVRAVAFDEGFGPKTIELVVVAAGSTLATTEMLDDLNTYFNGDKYAVPPLRKRVITNHEVTAVNYTPKAIDVVATVYGRVEPEEVENQLRRVVQPEAKKDDGTWEWEFGEDVPDSRINHIIFTTDESVTRVDMSVPSAPITLQSRELPVVGTVTITVIEP